MVTYLAKKGEIYMNIDMLNILNTYFNTDDVSLLLGYNSNELLGIFKILLALKGKVGMPKITSLIKKYIDSKFNNNIISLLTNGDIIENRTYDELLTLVYKYIESDYDDVILGYITDKDLLYNATFNTQLKKINDRLYDYYKDLSDIYIHAYYIDTYRSQKQINALLKKYVESDYNDIVLDIIEDEGVLKYRNFFGQIKLIEYFLSKKNIDDTNIYLIITNNKILKYRTIKEQIRLIEIYIKSNCDNRVFREIINENNIVNKNFNDQIRIINKKLNSDIEISVSEFLKKNGDTKKLENILKQNDISSFDSNTKIKVNKMVLEDAA